jgi:hypothetical protein
VKRREGFECLKREGRREGKEKTTEEKRRMRVFQKGEKGGREGGGKEKSGGGEEIEGNVEGEGNRENEGRKGREGFECFF